MSVFNLGVVAPTHKGVYNANTAYRSEERRVGKECRL